MPAATKSVRLRDRIHNFSATIHNATVSSSILRSKSNKTKTGENFNNSWSEMVAAKSLAKMSRSSRKEMEIFNRMEQDIVADENAMRATVSLAILLSLLCIFVCRSQMCKKQSSHSVVHLSLHQSVDHMSFQTVADVIRGKNKWDQYFARRIDNKYNSNNTSANSENFVQFEKDNLSELSDGEEYVECDKKRDGKSGNPRLHFGRANAARTRFAAYDGPLLHFSQEDDEQESLL